MPRDLVVGAPRRAGDGCGGGDARRADGVDSDG
jgi:hypothetical protein